MVGNTDYPGLTLKCLIASRLSGKLMDIRGSNTITQDDPGL